VPALCSEPSSPNQPALWRSQRASKRVRQPSLRDARCVILCARRFTFHSPRTSRRSWRWALWGYDPPPGRAAATRSADD
jgi:hypothetical protein